MKTVYTALAGALLTSTAAFAQPAGAPPPGTTFPPVASTPGAAPVAPVATARVMMLRWFVSDVARSEKFYQAVFGMTTAQRMGDNIRIMIFPGGVMPGMILIQSKDENRIRGSFVAQVSDVKATLATAAANGGKLLNTQFGQNIQGQAASSSHFEDPDGNVVEVLQIGGPRKQS